MPQRDKLTDWREAQFPLLQVGLTGGSTIPEQRCKGKRCSVPRRGLNKFGCRICS